MRIDSEKSEQTPIRCKKCGNKLTCHSHKVYFAGIFGELCGYWAAHCVCDTCAIHLREVYSSISRRSAIQMAKENGRYSNDV